MTATTVLTLLFLAGGLIWLVILVQRKLSRRRDVWVANQIDGLPVPSEHVWPKAETRVEAVKSTPTIQPQSPEVVLPARRIRPGRPADRPADSDAGFPHPLWLGDDHHSDRRDAGSERDNKPDPDADKGDDTVTYSGGGSDGGDGGGSD